MERETRVYTIKQVTFAEGEKLCIVHELEDEDRKGHWEEVARDRERFKRRIDEVENILRPVLSPERRNIIYQSISQRIQRETDSHNI